MLFPLVIKKHNYINIITHSQIFKLKKNPYIQPFSIYFSFIWLFYVIYSLFVFVWFILSTHFKFFYNLCLFFLYILIILKHFSFLGFRIKFISIFFREKNPIALLFSLKVINIHHAI